MTTKEAVKIAGKSESWLRRHQCAWCGHLLLYAIRDGCGAIYEKCDPKISFGASM